MVRIAGVQFVGNADKETNIRTAIRMVREAADRGARIICLPELFSTMYFCVETRREYFDWAEPIPGPTIDRLRDVARETGTVLIAPIFERAPDGRYFNSATVSVLPTPLTDEPVPFSVHCVFERVPLEPAVKGPSEPVAASFTRYRLFEALS